MLGCVWLSFSALSGGQILLTAIIGGATWQWFSRSKSEAEAQVGGQVSTDQQNTESVLNPLLSMTSETYITSAFIPVSVLKQKYLDNLLSTREIAKEFACSKTQVRKLLLKYNIPLRNRSERYGSHKQ